MLKNSDFKEWIEMCVKLNHINSFDYNEFTEQHLIGEGRFAFVKSAMMKCDVKVALKSLKVDVILEKSIIEEFVNEVDNRYGQYIMVLQFADSGNLRNYLDDSFTKLTWSDKFRMANAISSGLMCLHNKRIIHRDLHDKNILVHQGKLVIADFGLSRELNNKSSSASTLFGMTAFIEPKCFEDLSYKRDKRSDIYSLGNLLWEISSGKPPFASQSPYLLPQKIIDGKRENIIQGTPELYVELYQKCWNSEPINRPNAKKVFQILKIISSPNPPNNIPEISSDDETSSDEENDISLDGSDIDSSTSDDCDDKENMINILNDLVQLYTNMCQLGSSESDRSYENWFGNNISKSRRFFDFLKKNAEIVKHHEFILGKFYQRGFGVRQNNPKYFKWMERGTRKDDKLAYFELSKCYFFGKGVKKDNEKAYELYNRSNRI
ncbi:20185_t:CDS:2 [Funneliformis geosporum]|nr:20185_t:CDS:2 [Funneliformis geosporum]